MSDARRPEYDPQAETIGDRPTAPDQDESDAFDRLAEEFAERCRRGETPSIGEYEARYPEHTERVRKLLPTVALMEQWKRGMQQARAGGSPRSTPDRIGEFLVLREVGRGGMGVVYEAVQESLGRHVALKVIHDVHLDAMRLRRFQRETQAVAQLHHTNIVPIFGIGEHDGLPYYVMQYIQGSGLDALLGTWREGGPPRGQDHWRFVARVGMQVAEALTYAHEQGVLHRDIKPANLLIDEHQAVWITDFGLAKLTGHDDLTASGDVVGTLRYLAPEGLRGEADPRSDVYSLGLTLYEMLRMQPPFGESSTSELLRQVGEGQLPRPRKIAPAIPRDLETIVLKATAREPDHRYATAGALADDLECFLEDRPIRARRATVIERAWRWSRRNRSLAALTAAAAGSLLLTAVVGWVGYASTAREFDRAVENETLALQVFGELFDRLASRDNFLPPPLGRSQPAPRTGPGPGHPPPDQPGRPFHPAPGPPPRGPDGDPSAPDRSLKMGPQGPPRSGMPDDQTELLEIILNFYDRFARQNAKYPRLEGEAAWAYRRVGALYKELGREREAEEAYDRAIKMLEDLAAQFPNTAEYRIRLVDTYIMADPWSADSSSLKGLEQRLRRADELIEQLAVESPENTDYAQARVHVQAKLGTVLRRLGHAEDAAACYRRAIALEGELIERSSDSDRPRMDRVDTQEALGSLQLERGRRDEARDLLDAAANDLLALSAVREMSPPLADRFRTLAESYSKLGEGERAEGMSRMADKAGTRPSQSSPEPPGRGPRPPRPTEGPP